MRFVLLSVVLVVLLGAFAHSQTDRSAASKLLDNLKRGENVTISLGFSTRSTAGAYSIRVLTEDELKEITAKAEQYADAVREYEELRKAADEARHNARNRNEPYTQSPNLRPPRRPDPLYQVSVVGDDYVGLRYKGRDTLIPISKIASIRRQVEGP